MLEKPLFRWAPSGAMDLWLVESYEVHHVSNRQHVTTRARIEWEIDACWKTGIRSSRSPMLEDEMTSVWSGFTQRWANTREINDMKNDAATTPTKLCDEIYLDDTKIKERHPLEVAAFLDEAARRQYAKFYVYPFARLRLAFYAGKVEWKDRGGNDDVYTPDKLRETAQAIRDNFPNIVAMKLGG